MKQHKKIAILGGGPSGLLMFKRLVDSGKTNLIIDVFEKNTQLGPGMPYSKGGSNDEHITNVSGNEIPELVTSISDWIQTISQETLDRFHISLEKFSEYKVLPRLLFGEYLSAQFVLLKEKAVASGIQINVHLNSEVTDIIDHPDLNTVAIDVNGKTFSDYDRVIICTGHIWPNKHEGLCLGFYDSPYPPAKLAIKVNHTVAIKGSSLTAIDAIRTLARSNGVFIKNDKNKLYYQLGDESKNFKILMHSRNGLLPAIRFHLEDSHLMKDSILTEEEIKQNQVENEGFLSLDFVFEKNFKAMIAKKDPAFYNHIKEMKIEEFVASMMDLREKEPPFDLFRAEYFEAEQSIKIKESIYWKEMLAVLSFAMNYPAKYLSAEDMQRLQKVLMPLISIVIAFVPQGSVEEMLALNDAGILDIIAVGEDSFTVPHPDRGAVYHFVDEHNLEHKIHFKTFIDCVGQPHLSYSEIPYQSLLSKNTVSPAKIKFREAAAAALMMESGNKKVEIGANGDYYLSVPGITINDNFQVINPSGLANDRIYTMAVPYIGGYNPDYSGLDFCETSSAAVVKSLFND